MTVAFVQKSVELFADAASSIAPSRTGVTAGNHVALLVCIYTNATHTARSAPAGWSTAQSNTSSGTGTFRDQADIFYKENSAGGTESGTVILPAGSYAAASIVESSGVSTSNSLYNSNNNGGTTGTSSSTGNATSSDDCIVYAISTSSLGVGGIANFSSPATTGYTAIDTNADDSAHVAYDFSYKIANSSATENGGWTWTTTADGWQGAIAIFSAPTKINATPGTWTWAGSTSTLVRQPETAFQPTAFQSNAFQIYGGSTGTPVNTVNATPGTWSWAGAAQTIAVQEISAAIGTWSWAGTTAEIPTMLSAIPGTWTWAGSAATIEAQQINAIIGTWTWAGTTQTIVPSTISATPGTWTWAGSTSTIEVQVLGAIIGTWSWAGTTQIITTPGGVTEINATSGTWVWAGSTSSVEVPVIAASVGTWTWAGSTASISIASIDITAGAWSWAGSTSTIDNGEVVVEARQQGAGKSKRRRERYIARYKNEYYQFETLDDLEDFVAAKKAEEKVLPKRQRTAIKISLSPDFREEIQDDIEIPNRIQAMPVPAAMAQIRRIDQLFERMLARHRADELDDEETLLWLL